MKVLVFDTETTGLPLKNANIYNLDSWPYIVQLSYILYDLHTNKICVSHDHIIKIPKHCNLTEKSVEMHGITREKSENNGIDIKLALELFNICLKQSNFIIAHNIEFDKKILKIECMRNDISFNISPIKHIEYCTMKRTIELCNLKSKYQNYHNNLYKLKYPTLSELHLKLFNSNPSGVHDSFVDILICLRCFYKLMFNVDICDKNKKLNISIKKVCKT